MKNKPKHTADAPASIILNTKHKTLNSKHYNMLEFSKENSNLLTSSEPLEKNFVVTQKVASSDAEGLVEQAAQPKLQFISASLKKIKAKNSQSVNVDFRFEDSAFNQFNKINFELTNRYRDYARNIHSEWTEDWEYQQAEQYYKELLDGTPNDQKWIGKGKRRTTYKKGSYQKGKNKRRLAAVLHWSGQHFILWVWIQGNFQKLLLEPTDNERYPYRIDYQVSEQVEYEDEGGWI